MNTNDIAKLLHGANVTINVQGGHHNTMHTGPEQHNYSAIDTPQYCSICGNRMRNAANIANGYHSKCNARVIEQRRREDESAEFGRSMQQIAAQHREEIEPTPEQQARWYQTLAPDQQHQPPALIVINEPRQSYRDEIAAKYAGDYEQLQSSRAAYNAAEFERVNRSLHDWRGRFLFAKGDNIMGLMTALEKAVKAHRAARDAEVAARRTNGGRVVVDKKLCAAEEKAWKELQKVYDAAQREK